MGNAAKYGISLNKGEDQMNRRIIDESPLLIRPTLAAKVGLNEAIILQQIHYWNQILPENTTRILKRNK